MNVKKMSALLLSLVFIIFVTGCIPGDGSSSPNNPSGFFSGIWYGWIAPISLVWGFFNSSVRVYEHLNTGWWYDFGFYIAIIGGFGGISLIRRESRKKR